MPQEKEGKGVRGEEKGVRVTFISRREVARKGALQKSYSDPLFLVPRRGGREKLL
jgi:hypothetical protein